MNAFLEFFKLSLNNNQRYKLSYSSIKLNNLIIFIIFYSKKEVDLLLMILKLVLKIKIIYQLTMFTQDVEYVEDLIDVLMIVQDQNQKELRN